MPRGFSEVERSLEVVRTKFGYLYLLFASSFNTLLSWGNIFPVQLAVQVQPILYMNAKITYTILMHVRTHALI